MQECRSRVETSQRKSEGGGDELLILFISLCSLEKFKYQFPGGGMHKIKNIIQVRYFNDIASVSGGIEKGRKECLSTVLN